MSSRVTVSTAKNYIEMQMLLGSDEAAFAFADAAVAVELLQA